MNTFKMTMLGGLAAVSLAPLGAQAAYLLDTGIPSGSGLPVVLDSNDYAAAEFSLSAGQTITSIQAYVTAGIDTSGDTFTISLYSDGSLGGRNPTSVYSGQATYTADGWNGLTGLDITGLTAGNYWVALEVNGSSDSALGLALPTGATGGSAAAAVASLKRAGATRIRFMCLVAAPEGVKRLVEAHPDVMICCAALDRELNESGYILPGLGDAGDRLFGTR